MKKQVLTIRQPWAHLIMMGIKKIENRSWKSNYRGILYIHAASKVLKKDEFDEIMETYKNEIKKIGEIKYSDLEYGKIIAYAKMTDCVQKSDDPFYNEGDYGFVLSEVKKIDSIPAKGNLGIWSFVDSGDDK